MKKSMKWVLAGAVVLSLIGVACKKEEAYVGVPVQEVSTVYDLKDVQSYTIDGDGNLYCFQVEFPRRAGHKVLLSLSHCCVDYQRFRWWLLH